MIASFNDLSFFKDQDRLRIFHSGKAVGDDKDGPVFHKGVHTLFNEIFRTGVNGTGSLIQDQHRWAGNGCPGNGQQLTLSLGKIASVRIEHGIIPHRQTADKRICAGQLRRLMYFLICGIQPAITDVFHDGPCKQMRILNDHGE